MSAEFSAPSCDLRSGRFARHSDLWFRLEGQLEVHMNAIRILATSVLIATGRRS